MNWVRQVPRATVCGHRLPWELDGTPGDLSLGPYDDPAHKQETCHTAHKRALKQPVASQHTWKH
jgi:hypothetical protein